MAIGALFHRLDDASERDVRAAIAGDGCVAFLLSNPK